MSQSPPPTPKPRTVLGRGSYAENLRIGEILRKETVGGLVLIVGALLAIVWANSPASGAYFALRDFHIGFEIAGIDLNLSLGHWAADGLLAVFFFLVGLELKKEFVAGDLRDFKRAVVPVAAAFGGVLVPAVIFVAINASSGGETLRGWAIPTATDIAFAVAVLAVIGSNLPSPLRIFLLTLAVVDDLIAIIIIAFVFTDELRPPYLLMAIVPIALYAFFAHKWPRFFATKRWAPWLILLPLGLIAWALVFGSGIHATIAGVVLGFCVPVTRKDAPDKPGLAETFEHRFRPLSSGLCVPIFAFFAAGVAIGGASGIASALGDPVLWGIVLGLLLGKPIGIMASTWLVTRSAKANLDPDVKWGDLLGVTLLAGIGFTVSLLVSELSFGLQSPHYDHAKVAILLASVLAAVIGSLWLIPRNKRYREIAARDKIDADGDGIPDTFQ
ncbi:Na+/H+ antiporter NhaA [Paeniglutamicibacter cryotolerans]|uniref:Na(+)/H(+) antiporter NhaA n=1 Tax=Paeniglutamicibacter cryotolerans TaxID=670079 RepID=A0A839QML9_9MICC|nr:Na+/H+ antiporter NhaA [Paeniglutamicibacter cryotolerans]MBB2996004.1 NhaA family Na+:H+ antiporter [Paeniglutamicibacter cryotolerans]